jgi:hypothetical protein
VLAGNRTIGPSGLGPTSGLKVPTNSVQINVSGALGAQLSNWAFEQIAATTDEA